MKKTLLAGLIALSFGSNQASATNFSIAVDTMNFGTSSVVTGSLTAFNGTASGQINGSFFNAPWTADALEVFEGAGPHTWAGTSPEQGAFSYNFTLESTGQVAFALYFTWSVNPNIPVIAIFDCDANNDGVIVDGEACTGTDGIFNFAGSTTDSDGDGDFDGPNGGYPMEVGPFPGQDPAFDGAITIPNIAPVAVDDSITPVYNGGATTVSPAANDTDANAGDTLTAACNNDSTKGVIIDNGDSTCSYTPNSNQIGVDSFTYTVSDGRGGSDTGTVNVNITDQTPPIITILPGTDTVDLNSSWTDAGATATDNLDDNATVTANIQATGAVDITTLGQYTITYTVSDAAGNVATATRTVTVSLGASPVITITPGTDTIEAGSQWVDAGATATDAEDGSVSVTTTGSVDTNTAGTYTITYSATDSVGNTTTANRVVTVTADVTAPVITVMTGNDSIEAGTQQWVDAGATATDNLDTSVNIVTSGTVNSNVPGQYIITYTATDAAGNTASVTRTVTVTDLTPPVILVTTGTDTLEVGTQWTDAGATAVDALDGVITVNVSGTVNTSIAGDYIITYTATDAAGNTATQTRTVTVTADTTAPVITLTGGAMELVVGSDFNDLGAVCSDNLDADKAISTSDSVDTNTVGTYVVTYTCEDSAGNAADAVTRTVVVKPDDTNKDSNAVIAGCSMSANSGNPADAADWWVLAGFIGFMAVRRRKAKTQN